MASSTKKRPAAATKDDGPLKHTRNGGNPWKEVVDFALGFEEDSLLGCIAHPKGDHGNLNYGTAGFRADAKILDHVLFRMGILAALRSKALNGESAGLMVTASHNPERDNGVKLIEPSGDMLPIEWEDIATDLANTPDADLSCTVRRLAAKCNVDLDLPCNVSIGRDTRASGNQLAMSACDGATVLGANVRSLGLVTTPQLHYHLRCHSTRGQYGEASVLGYFRKLLNAFHQSVKYTFGLEKKYKQQLVVDCANGVGAMAMAKLRDDFAKAGLDLDLRNMGEGALNEGCGADFVKVSQVAPAGLAVSEKSATVRCASIDGDADRVVYFSVGDGGFKLLDGDRIALLLTRFIAKLIGLANLPKFRMGLVQTAYANGGSTAYAVQVLGQENIVCAKTGVKHCHAAAKAMDVGIYFEANGHGTIIFSDALVAEAKRVADESQGDAAKAAQQLLYFRDVINESVGDAISIILAVEVALRVLDWSVDDWWNMYTDLSNRQVKVVVKDRNIFETTNAERTCVKPDGLQAKINCLVAERAPDRGRAFVRPSGTEDVVRVYVEAGNLEQTLSLAQSVADAVYDLGGGVGKRTVLQ